MKEISKWVVVGIAFVLLGGGVLLFPGAAQATTFTFNLSNWNVGLFETNGDQVKVTADDVAKTIRFEWVQGTGVAGKDLQDLYITRDLISEGDCTSGCGNYAESSSGGGPSGGGFGNGFRKFHHNAGADDLDVTFTFSSFLHAPVAADFVAHVQFNTTGSCSGFVGNLNVATTTAEAGCTSSVPEPSSSLLLGLTLSGVAVVLWGREKFMSQFMGTKA